MGFSGSSFCEQERMALFHCLAVVISSLLVVWIMEKVGMSIIVVLEKCGVSCLKKECDFREDIEETVLCAENGYEKWDGFEDD